MAIQIQLRRGSESQWSSADPILAQGEVAYSTDSNKIKIGDGTNIWSSLPYLTTTPTEITAQIDAAVSGLIDSAPGVLDTLNEIAAALNDDPDFFNTVATNLSNHESDTTNVHGIADTSLLATTAYVDTAESDAITAANSYSDSLAINYDSAGSAATAESNANSYTDNSINALTTDDIEEGINNKYFLDSRAQDAAGAMFDGNTESGISVTYDNINKKINLDVNDPTITLSGDVSGSATMTNLGNINIIATVADDSHNHIISNVDGLQIALDDKAPLASPALTGVPTAPTAADGTNSTQIATTAFVQAATAALVDSAPTTLNTLNELAAALGDDPNFATTISTELGNKQPLDADLTAISALAGTSGLLKKTAADTWALDTNTYLTTNQTITISGDVSGSGTTSITATLSNTGVSANTYGSSTAIPVITVDAKGRITEITTSSVEGLPSQTGNSGKYLTTDGSTASWATVEAGLNPLLLGGM